MKLFRYITLILATLLPFSPMAKDSTVTRLLTAQEADAWTAVGRLNIGGKGTCTGALIAPNQVLTAAHCVYDDKKRELHKPETIIFLAGWRKGFAVAHRVGRKIVVPKQYSDRVFDGTVDKSDIIYDIAVIELERPIGPHAAIPFEVRRQPSKGEELTVVSYSRRVNEVQTLETGCEVLARDSKVIVSDCIVDFGASGSPMFTYENGVPKIASVLSAMGTSKDRKVAYGVALSFRLEEMLGRLQNSNLLFNSKRVGEKTLAEQLGRE